MEAALRSVARSERLIGIDISVRISTAFAAARWKDSAMTVGWRPYCYVRKIPTYLHRELPLPSNFSAAPRRLPAITTTDVVPSPASISCALARSTNILAAGCITLMSLSMVFPSLVY